MATSSPHHVGVPPSLPCIHGKVQQAEILPSPLPVWKHKAVPGCSWSSLWACPHPPASPDGGGGPEELRCLGCLRKAWPSLPERQYEDALLRSFSAWPPSPATDSTLTSLAPMAQPGSEDTHSPNSCRSWVAWLSEDAVSRGQTQAGPSGVGVRQRGQSQCGLFL